MYSWEEGTVFDKRTKKKKKKERPVQSFWVNINVIPSDRMNKSFRRSTREINYSKNVDPQHVRPTSRKRKTKQTIL